MNESIAAITTALRVLTAINQKRHPDEADLDQLRHFAPPLSDLPPDELACTVVELGLKSRRRGRAAGA